MASIGRKYQAAGAHKKKQRSGSDSPKAIQAKEKPRLLRELLPEPSSSADEPGQGSNAYEGLTLEALTTKLADLEARLAGTKEFDWRELYRDAQKETSLKNYTGYKGLPAANRKTLADKSTKRFKAKIQEINKHKGEHEVAVKRLQGSIAALKSYIAKQKAGEKELSAGAETHEAAESERKERLQELRRKKEELLRKKDELAVRMAQLKAAKQGATSTHTPSLGLKAQPEPHESSDQTEPSSIAQIQEPQSFAAPLNRSSAARPQPPLFDPKSLRLHLPGGKVKIDSSLSIDINAPTKSLRRQVSALRDRLKQFHPPLDHLPVGFSGRGVSGNHQYRYKTWLKILVSRYQAKTGVEGVIEKEDDELQKDRERRFVEMTLSEEAKERMAKRWNQMFGEKRGVVMRSEDLARDEEKESQRERVTETKSVKESDVDEDYNEMGFLQDEHVGQAENVIAQGDNVMGLLEGEYATEGELFAAQNEPDEHAPAPSAPSIPSQSTAVPTTPQQTVTMRDSGKTVPVPSTRPPINSPKFEAGALHRLQDSSNDLNQTKQEAAEALEHILEAAELGRGNEDDAAAAAEGIPIRYKPSKGRYMHTSSPRQAEEVMAKRAVESRRPYSTSSRPPLDQLNQGLAEKAEQQNPTASTSRKDTETPAASAPPSPSPPQPQPQPHLPHLTSTGSAHMVSISSKSHTTRTAIAVGTVYFSNPVPLSLITSNSLKKGDVLSVSRIAGIMAAKKCPEIVPLCHPIPLTHVGVELRTFPPPPTTSGVQTSASASAKASAPTGPDNMAHGGVQIECKVACTGATGVEMEALTAVMGTALSVVDMCKAVDKFQRIGDVRVVLKEGGKSGVWREESWKSWQEEEEE